MKDFSIAARVQFPAMNWTYHIRLSPRHVGVLDQHAERQLLSDGRSVYVLPEMDGNRGYLELLTPEMEAALRA